DHSDSGARGTTDSQPSRGRGARARQLVEQRFTLPRRVPQRQSDLAQPPAVTVTFRVARPAT
ncbi:MAG: hypothetical protein ACRDL5_14690, partial [Solirubrobacteraceae bacterium]